MDTALPTDAQLEALTHPAPRRCRWDEGTPDPCQAPARWRLRSRCCGTHSVVCPDHLDVLHDWWQDPDMDVVCVACRTPVGVGQLEVRDL